VGFKAEEEVGKGKRRRRGVLGAGQEQQALPAAGQRRRPEEGV
jgi:hypothetical protein